MRLTPSLPRATCTLPCTVLPPCTCTWTCTCLHLRFCQFHGIALKPPRYLCLPFSPCLHLLAVLIPHGPHPMSSRLLVTIAFRFSPRARKDCRRWCRIEYPPVQAVRAVPLSLCAPPPLHSDLGLFPHPLPRKASREHCLVLAPPPSHCCVPIPSATRYFAAPSRPPT